MSLLARSEETEGVEGLLWVPLDFQFPNSTETLVDCGPWKNLGGPVCTDAVKSDGYFGNKLPHNFKMAGK